MALFATRKNLCFKSTVDPVSLNTIDTIRHSIAI